MVDPTPGRPTGWRHRHLLDVDALTAAELELVMRTADGMHGVLTGSPEQVLPLAGRQAVNLFYEASTRTRVSFELAARRLGAEVVNIAVAASSVTKGESLVDTVRTLEALGAGIIVLRHARSGAPYLVARHFSGHVVNAGDGWHAHPTQALLDLYTLRRHVPGGEVRGRKVVIMGDILHSRVARSNVWTLTTTGVDLWLCGPAPLLRGFEAWARALAPERRLTVTSDPDVALRDAEAVMALRIQRERLDGSAAPSGVEYAARYGLTAHRLRLARRNVIVLHPGPMNEGVEIAPEVATGPGSVITEQVANGVAIRMAVMALISTVPRA